MKKHMMIGIVFMMTSLSNVTAQDSANISATVARSFSTAFPEATKVYWTSLPKSISKAQFGQHGTSWLAFFDKNGNILSSGRRIRSVSGLPLKVQTGLLQTKARMEKKFGELVIVHMYEMVSGDATRYLSSFENAAIRLTVSVSAEGNGILERKTAKPGEATPTAPSDVIAKKNR